MTLKLSRKHIVKDTVFDKWPTIGKTNKSKVKEDQTKKEKVVEEELDEELLFPRSTTNNLVDYLKQKTIIENRKRICITKNEWNLEFQTPSKRQELKATTNSSKNNRSILTPMSSSNRRNRTNGGKPDLRMNFEVDFT